MKRYMGFSQSEDGSGGAVVQVVDAKGSRALNPRFDLRNHSPTGFSWGFAGSGPAQMALALCADALDDDERARRVYQRFKFRVVARWKMGEPWTITQADIVKAVEAIERERNPAAG
jgi:hypothetical protein